MKKALLALLFATTVLLPFNAEARARKPVYLMTEEEKEEHRETKRKQSVYKSLPVALMSKINLVIR